MAELTQADLDAAIAKVKAEYETRIEAIDAKKNEALEEAKKAKQALRASQEIKPEDFAALEAENDKLKAELSKASGDLKQTAKALETANKQLEAESGFTQKLLVDNGLTEALTSAGVKEAPHLKAVKALLAPQVAIAVEGDQRIAKVGDKPLTDFVKEWASSEEGKFFVSAPNNSGGGAPGGKGGGADTKTIQRSQFDSMDPGQKMAFVKDGGKVLDQAA